MMYLILRFTLRAQLFLGLVALFFFPLSLSIVRAGTWTGSDVGSVGVAGSDSYNSATGVYTISGSGADINGTADAFHFVYQTLTGDGELEARVGSLQNTNGAAKAGLMIRQSTAAGSINGFIAITPTNGINFEQRTTLNGSTTLVQTSANTMVPYWLKIIKDGTLISVYQAPDGINWTYQGEVRLTSLTNPVDIGFAVTSHSNTLLCTATFDNITFSSQTTYAPTFPWNDQDIGSPAQTGQAHVEQYYWSLYGGGSGIGSTADSFHYAYQSMSGNGMVIAQVNALGTNSASSGVVMRQDLTAGSAEADLILNATGGITFGTRTSAGAVLSNTTGAQVTAPYWVKLVRLGNTFYGYQSADGLTWTLVGSQTITMTGTIYVGAGATCGNNGALALAILDRVWVLPTGDYLGIGAISSGSNHNLYLQPNGSVWAWGLNANGQIGDGTTTTRLSPVPVTNLSGVAAVSAGASHSVALASDGTVWVWGLNSNGQLGDGTTTSENSPEHLSSLSGIVAISSGAAHTLALASDGTVWVWGLNSNGQLGDGTTTQQLSPEHLTSLKGIVAISAGGSHSLALRGDGAVFAWGNNSTGQLGDGTTTQQLSPEQITSLSNAAAVSAGTSHSLVVGDDGSVWSWGDNSYGELGNNSTTQSNSPIQVTGVSGITAVKASNLFSVSLKNDGTIWTWGNNVSGQLGNNSTTEENSPVQASIISGAWAISAGTSHGAALTAGAIWTWGGNTYGQLGNGSNTPNLVPTAINPGVPVITSSTTANGSAGSAFTYTITASNLPIGFAATGLPSGLTVNTTTGVISGTPVTAGTYMIPISASNFSGTGSAVLTLTVSPGIPVITSPATATGTTGVAFSYTLVATNSPTSFSASGLPPGLSINTANGAISGTPITSGTYTVSLGAGNSAGTGLATLIITINPPTPVITSSTAANGVTGTVFTYQITANNSPVSFSATGLPSGLSINTSTGAITGTPTTSGTSSVTLGATNGSGTGSATLTLTINLPAPVINSGATATGILGTAYSGYTITATNSPTSYSATGLPPGLIVNTASGAITGTPTTTGTFPATVGASNATGTGTATLTFTINSQVPVITSATTATGTKGVAYSGYTITANNSPVTFSATGLPAGLAINTSTGAITGTPTATGTSTVTLGAINPSGTGSATLAFTINAPTPVISSATTASGTNGAAFNYSIVASNSPTNYQATGLPSGLAVNTSTGAISGTPTETGTFTVTLGATNANGTGTLALTLTINSPTPVITSPASSVGTTGSSFNYSITANNSPTSYNATGLPAGLSVSTSTGAITGTPTAVGTSSVTLSAINSNGTGTSTLSLTINAPKPVISSGATATGTVGTAFSGYTIAASNSPTSFGATGLPAGLSVSTSTGAISGTPTTPGTYSVTIGATNATGTGTATLTFTVNPPKPAINSLSSALGTTGVAFSYSITASNTPTTYSASPLPAGLSVSTSTGKISGTPTATGTTTVALGAINASGTGTATLSITINSPLPVISSAATASGTINSAFSGYTITASNSPTSYSASGLPSGLSVNTTSGVISGTPTAEGIFAVTLGATNGSGTGIKTLTITVKPLVPVISSATTATGTLGVAFSSYNVAASNTPTSYSASGLPAGLSINTASGAITGTPTTAGVSTVTLGATNGNGTGNATLMFTINQAKPVIHSATTASGATGVAFNSYSILASNSPTSYGATGLPAGLSVNTTTGAISGTPTTTGTSTVSLSATNGSGTGTGTLTFVVASGATPVITSAATATGTTGSAISSYTIAASNSPTSFSATGLPAGLSVSTSTGAITGTPTTVGVSYVTLGATNSHGTGTATLTFTVNPPAPVITSPTTATAVKGTAFTDYAITATNNPTTRSATGLPAGLSVNTATGAITGTPTATGTSTVSLSATNATGTGTLTLTFTVNPALPVITSSSTANATTGSAFTYSTVASNTPTSYTASGLPAGLSINSSSGAITGTPTIAGVYTVTLGAANVTGTGTLVLTITVNPPTPVITSATSVTGIVGSTFSGYTITANNKPTGYNATNLPAGLAVNTTSGAITGTPTTAGPVTVALSAINAGGTGTQNLTFTVNNPTPVITSATTASATTGLSFSGYTITASNTPTSFSATGLPAGLSVNTTSGAITGTPTSTGTYSITIGASNPTGTGKATLTLTVSPPQPVINSLLNAVGVTGSSFTYAITATNTPTSFNATGLPAGLSVSTSTGKITGTPTATGTSTVSLSAANATGTGTATLSITINSPKPVISSGSNATGIVGTTFPGYSITASNSPTSFEATGLPSGLSVNTSTGAISGTPTTPGTFTVTIGATNATGTGTLTLTITISPPVPVITSLGSATGVSGSSFTYSTTASNSPTNYSATGLPSGLSINTTNGSISGTPTVTGTSSVTLSATNAAGTGNATLNLVINPPAPVITSAASATGTIGALFTYPIVATNSPAAYNATGLPAGLSLNTGTISGTPTVAATSTIILGASNATGTGTLVLTLTVNPPQPVVTSLTSAVATAGGAFNYVITASNSPSSYSAAGLPAGLSVDLGTGIISGSPTVVGTSSVTLGATNATGTGSATLTLIVNAPPPVITSATAANGLTGVPFNYTTTATNTPTTYGATGLPSGLTISSTTGVISGIPTVAGTYAVAISASNSGGMGTSILNLTISASPPVTSGLTAWYKADSGVTTNSGSITQWNDQTGQFNITQTPGTSAPTAAVDPGSGRPVISFNGSQFLSTGAQVAGINDITIFTVASAPNTGESGVQVQVGAGYGSACTRGLAYIGGNEAFTNGINSSGYFTSVSGGPAVQNSSLTTNTLTYSASTSTASFYSNGAANGTASLGTVATASGLIVGDAITYGNYYNWNGNIAEIIIYNRVLSTSERQQVEAYLSNKYAVPPVITSATTASGNTATAFNYTITASDGAYTFSATGLPSGLSVNSTTGVISGTPSVAGTFPVTLSATNNGGSGTSTLTLTVYPALPPVINSSNASAATVGLGFSYTIIGTNYPTSYNATGLPAGLSINTSTGVISGTPTTSGTSTISLSATNAWGTGTASLVLTTYPTLPVTSGLAAWFNSSTGISTSGGSVTQWNDQSGNGENVTQVAGANAPTTGTDPASGNPVLVFNGNQLLTSSTQINGLDDTTIITVASSATPSINFQTQVVVGALFDGEGARIFAYDSGKEAFANSSSTVDGGTVPPNTALNINTVTFSESGGTATFYSQGAANGSQPITATSLAAGLTIGSVSYTPYQCWNGNIAEVIVYNRVLTTAERQQIEVYLANKYKTYVPGATWISSYSTSVQAEINRNKWSKAQADAYVAFQAANPTMLTTGLTSWFKADAISASNGSNLSSWVDQTGNYTPSQAVTANQPKFVSADINGKPAVRYSGNQWLYNSNDLGLNADMTMITVCARSTTNTGFQSMLYLGNQNGYSSRGQAYNAGLEDFDSGSGNACTGGPQPGVNQFTIEACALSSNLTNLTFYQNGQQTATGTLTSAAQAMTQGLTIGCANNGWGAFFQGDIEETLVYDHQLSTAELQQVTTYLANKYGIYSQYATWPQAYSTAVQAEITRNQWTKTQADAYVALQTNNPSMLTNGLKMWLRADMGVTLGVGSNVIGWADQTGSYPVAPSTIYAQPTLVTNDSNGQPALRFSGDQSLVNPNSLGVGASADMTVITVGMTTSPSTQQYSFYSGNGTGGETRALGYQNSAEFFDTTGSTAMGVGAPTSNAFTAEASSINSTLSTVNFYRNGTLTTTGTLTGVQSTVSPGISVGNSWQGDIAEVLVYDHQLSPTELQQVSLYLANKYGLYYSGASWISSYTSAVQTQINANQWTKAQADAYVQITQTLPVANGLTAWFRPDKGVIQDSITKNVTSWQDSSLNHNDVTQTTASNQPTVVTDPGTGTKTIHFNGSQYLANNNNLSSVNDVTIITMASTPTPTASNRTTQVVIGQNYGTTAVRSLLYDYGAQSFSNGSPPPNYFVDFADGGAVSSATSLTTSAVTYSSSTSTVSFYKNGVTNGTATVNTTPVTTGLALGSYNTYGNFLNWNGNISEVLIFNRVLSSSELAQIQTYLTTKYAALTAAPTISPNGGSFSSSTSVTLSGATSPAVICYTLDGSVPTSSSPQYAAPFNVTKDTVVNCAIFQNGVQISQMATAQFWVGDTNHIGISDAWQIQYFGGLGIVNPSALTPGGSGLTNLQAYQWGYNPTMYSTNGDGLSDLLNHQLGYAATNTDINGYLNSSGQPVTNAQQIAMGLDPFDVGVNPTPTPPLTDPGDTTPPTITLIQPANATRLP